MKFAIARMFSLALALGLFVIPCFPLVAVQADVNAQLQITDLANAMSRSRESGDPILVYVYDSS